MMCGYNIDGDMSNSWGWNDSVFYNGSRFFGFFFCDDSDTEDTASTEDVPPPPHPYPTTFAELIKQHQSQLILKKGQRDEKKKTEGEGAKIDTVGEMSRETDKYATRGTLTKISTMPSEQRPEFEHSAGKDEKSHCTRDHGVAFVDLDMNEFELPTMEEVSLIRKGFPAVGLPEPSCPEGVIRKNDLLFDFDLLDAKEATYGDERIDEQFEAKPSHPTKTASTASKSGSRRRRKSTWSKYNFRNGEFEKCAKSVMKHGKKGFEELTVRELRMGYEEFMGKSGKVAETDVLRPPGLLAGEAPVMQWFDYEVNCFLDNADEDQRADGHVLGFSWRSEPEEWNNRKWVKVDSVMDSGASAPVAPPGMLPNVKVQESEGSRRGQQFTSASKHKLRNLGRAEDF